MPKIQTYKIILASASPRREKLLKSMGIKFQIIPAKIRESYSRCANSNKIAEDLALKKAESVSGKLKNSKNLKNALVIGADTIVILGKEILGKPKNKKDAFRMLSILSGKTHRVLTGLALIDIFSGKTVTVRVKSTVRFKKLSLSEINQYLKTSEYRDKAGAYAIQGKGRDLIAGFSGPEDNIIGLPREALQKMLKTVISEQ